MSKILKPGTYHLSVHDNKISTELKQEVEEHVLDQTWFCNFYDPPHSSYNPRTDKYITERKLPAQPKLPLAWDDTSLRERDPVVYKLWESINATLDNQFEIEGVTEGISYMTGISPLSSLPKPDGSPGRANCGWRVFGNGNERELSGRTKSIHRDNPFLDDDTYYGIVYFANKEWHPQYYGETIFHSNDAITGDHTGRFDTDQRRNYPIGEPENIVMPLPGRFMLFDNRYLHQIKPTAHWAPIILGIVFRVRLRPGIEFKFNT